MPQPQPPTDLQEALLALYRAEAAERWSRIAERLGALAVGARVRARRMPSPGPGPGRAYVGREGTIVECIPRGRAGLVVLSACLHVCVVDFGPGDGLDGRDTWAFGDTDLEELN